MEAKLPQITLGETVCEKLRTIYFKDILWPECYKDVARAFTQLKIVARKFYCDKNEYEVLMELARYSLDDIKDAIDGLNGMYYPKPHHAD